MGFLTGKRVLIMGVVSNRSIAYGIAKAMREQGAELAFTYQHEKVRERVADLAKTLDSDLVWLCDVSSDEDIDNTFKSVAAQWQGLDILIHSLAYAPADQLTGEYWESVTREGFRIAHEISSYSLAAVTKAAVPLMPKTGAILTLTYIGGERVVQHYNTMGVAKASLEANVKYLAASVGPKGIRVNAISAGPIKTLAAAGIKDFRKMLNAYSILLEGKKHFVDKL